MRETVGVGGLLCSHLQNQVGGAGNLYCRLAVAAGPAGAAFPSNSIPAQSLRLPYPHPHSHPHPHPNPQPLLPAMHAVLRAQRGGRRCLLNPPALMNPLHPHHPTHPCCLLRALCCCARSEEGAAAFWCRLLLVPCSLNHLCRYSCCLLRALCCARSEEDDAAFWNRLIPEDQRPKEASEVLVGPLLIFS